jgi:SAM-dependent methyltransferase
MVVIALGVIAIVAIAEVLGPRWSRVLKVLVLGLTALAIAFPTFKVDGEFWFWRIISVAGIPADERTIGRVVLPGYRWVDAAPPSRQSESTPRQAFWAERRRCSPTHCSGTASSIASIRFPTRARRPSGGRSRAGDSPTSSWRAEARSTAGRNVSWTPAAADASSTERSTPMTSRAHTCLRRAAPGTSGMDLRGNVSGVTIRPAGDPWRWRERLQRLRRPALLWTIRRTTPLSDHYGRDRGTPVDRYYIEQFLEAERTAIRGRVLEVLNREYTERFGMCVVSSDVLDIDGSNPHATIISDLAAADSVATASFDCFILTQTLQYIYDLKAAVRHAHRILAPGGTLLTTVPVVSRIDRLQLESEFWRLTAAACARLFGDVFGGSNVSVRARGNVLAAAAFLVGMSAEELSRRQLERDDRFFPVVVTVRATKAS